MIGISLLIIWPYSRTLLVNRGMLAVGCIARSMHYRKDFLSTIVHCDMARMRRAYAVTLNTSALLLKKLIMRMVPKRLGIYIAPLSVLPHI
ncbi:MAG: hypothetical protein UV48_C0025G0005 [Candidatus Azambacteria bacterium GW2011_GWA2_42_9]|uniref:Uncharacterized protein n=1 Tax=Candidatus Azambacteria bacterium GW2011_GWA2_42_9 TaxID=1618613 RepID=A0A0G1BNI9_9BACT|nr:MAG: hypothetical protein UV48_C0025G0005 [Candidatus Azambacteria bacterium GW2011_GWA2_42_9]